MPSILATDLRGFFFFQHRFPFGNIARGMNRASGCRFFYMPYHAPYSGFFSLDCAACAAPYAHVPRKPQRLVQLDPP